MLDRVERLERQIGSGVVAPAPAPPRRRSRRPRLRLEPRRRAPTPSGPMLAGARAGQEAGGFPRRSRRRPHRRRHHRPRPRRRRPRPRPGAVPELDDVIEAWPAALEALKAPVRATIQEAQPIGIERGAIVFGAPRKRFDAINARFRSEAPAIKAALEARLGVAAEHHRASARLRHGRRAAARSPKTDRGRAAEPTKRPEPDECDRPQRAHRGARRARARSGRAPRRRARCRDRRRALARLIGGGRDEQRSHGHVPTDPEDAGRHAGRAGRARERSDRSDRRRRCREGDRQRGGRAARHHDRPERRRSRPMSRRSKISWSRPFTKRPVRPRSCSARSSAPSLPISGRSIWAPWVSATSADCWAEGPFGALRRSGSGLDRRARPACRVSARSRRNASRSTCFVSILSTRAGSRRRSSTRRSASRGAGSASTSPRASCACTAATIDATAGCCASSRSRVTSSRSNGPASSKVAITCCRARSRRSRVSVPSSCASRSCSRVSTKTVSTRSSSRPTPTSKAKRRRCISRGLLKPLGMLVTRIASGLPVGGDLEYADEVTLGRAFEGRRDVERSVGSVQRGVGGTSG